MKVTVKFPDEEISGRGRLVGVSSEEDYLDVCRIQELNPMTRKI